MAPASAVLENSYYAEVKNLLDRNELDDARAKLDAWALEFPLARLAGDYHSPRLGMPWKFGDYTRAQRLFKAYRTHVDLSAPTRRGDATRVGLRYASQ